MSHRGRRNADETILLHLARGMSIRVTAKKTDVSERTINRRMQEPEFQQRLAEMRADLVRKTANQLTAHGLAAVNTLKKLLKANAESVRLRAAQVLLEAGCKWRESEELEARLVALEQRQEAKERMMR